MPQVSTLDTDPNGSAEFVCPRCAWREAADAHSVELSNQAAQIERLSQEKRELQETVADFERSVAELHRDSMTDALTGVPNRRSLWIQLPHAVETAEVSQRAFTVLFLDIDHFKGLNDGFGHLTGDLVLRQLASLLRSHLRGSDMVSSPEGEGAVLARYGGEEFVVVLPATGIEGGVAAAERLRALVRTVPFHSTDRRALPAVTVSVGVAEYDFVVDSWDFEGVLDRADAALYDAKNAGRDCVRTRRVS